MSDRRRPGRAPWTQLRSLEACGPGGKETHRKPAAWSGGTNTGHGAAGTAGLIRALKFRMSGDGSAVCCWRVAVVRAKIPADRLLAFSGTIPCPDADITVIRTIPNWM